MLSHLGSRFCLSSIPGASLTHHASRITHHTDFSPVKKGLRAGTGAQLHLAEVAPLDVTVQHGDVAAQGNEAFEVSGDVRHAVGARNEDVIGWARVCNSGIGNQHPPRGWFRRYGIRA